MKCSGCNVERMSEESRCSRDAIGMNGGRASRTASRWARRGRRERVWARAWIYVDMGAAAPLALVDRCEMFWRVLGQVQGRGTGQRPRGSSGQSRQSRQSRAGGCPRSAAWAWQQQWRQQQWQQQHEVERRTSSFPALRPSPSPSLSPSPAAATRTLGSHTTASSPPKRHGQKSTTHALARSNHRPSSKFQVPSSTRIPAGSLGPMEKPFAFSAA
jgi:hypothetical protein